MKKCLGCGITLQYKDKDKPGYTQNEDNPICERCFKIKHYNSYKKVSLTNEDYQKIWDNIPKTSFTIYVTDIFSLDYTKIDTFKNIILVINKIDILPKSLKKEKIINYIKKQHPNIKDIVAISSKTCEGIDTLYNKIKTLSKQKTIYIVGTTNSGKSTLINRLISLYGIKETKDNITTSMYPSTTLNKIEVKLKDITLIDTPGLINDNNIINYLDIKDIKKIMPKKEIKPKTCQIEGIGSIIIDNYTRIDYQTTKKTSIVIYASNLLNIKFISTNNDIHHEYKKHILEIPSNKDIVILGLCFIKCTDNIKMDIYTIKNIKPIIRDNLI